MVPLPVDLDRGDIKVEAGQFVAQRFALGGDNGRFDLAFSPLQADPYGWL